MNSSSLATLMKERVTIKDKNSAPIKWKKFIKKLNEED